MERHEVSARNLKLQRHILKGSEDLLLIFYPAFNELGNPLWLFRVLTPGLGKPLIFRFIAYLESQHQAAFQRA